MTADAELKVALAAFMRDWIGEDFFGSGRTEEDFEHLVERISNDPKAPVAPMLRAFHAAHGRYPTLRELSNRRVVK